ncbi:hypothetical protein FKM82_011774 [Ascaphus truei]
MEQAQFSKNFIDEIATVTIIPPVGCRRNAACDSICIFHVNRPNNNFKSIRIRRFDLFILTFDFLTT